MKFFIATLALTFCLMMKSYAGDLLPVSAVVKQGHAVLMGELTGAGSKISIKNLHGLILPEGVLLTEDITEMVVKTSLDPKVEDIVKIKAGDSIIPAHEFIGLVTK